MESFLTIRQLQALLEKKEIQQSDICDFYSKRIAKHNQRLNALIEAYDDTPLPSSEHGGTLAGIPGILKDNIALKGKTVSCGSKMLKKYRAPYDSTVAKRLKAEGAPIIGRSNMDEFAMGASGEFSAYGPTRNPWELSHSPGGSSSGSAAAVAAGLAPWALGTETGGSVRQPASFCGLVGLYPTYGLFSRYGVVAFTSSTDQPGPITKTVYDNALVASTLSGHDPLDGTSISRPRGTFTRNLNGKMPQNITIGIIEDSLTSSGVDDEVKASFEAAVKQLEHLGVTTKVVSLPDLKYGISVYFVISRAEAASNLYRFDGSLYGYRNEEADDLFEMYIKTRHEGFGNEVMRRILMGNYVLSSVHKGAFYDKALAVRSIICEEFTQAFKNVDLLISPTTPTLPFTLGKESSDDLKMYLADYFTVPMCIAGIPTLSLPCGFSKEGLPIGFQFIGPRLSESLLYQVAYAYEQSTDHHTKHPQGF